jgi:hypothetical protein
LSADKTAAAAKSRTFVGSSSEVNSPVSVNRTESEGDLADLLDEISYKLNFEEVQIFHIKTADQRTTSTSTTNSTPKRTSPIFTMVCPMVLRMNGR